VQDVIRLSQRVAAPAPALWQAVATPGGLSTWQADEVTGEVRAGRTLTLRYPGLGARLVLEVAAVEPGRRLVLTRGPSRLELRVGDGAVELEHFGVSAGDEAEGTRSSWRIALATLAEAVERYRGQPRTVHAVTGPTRAPAELCHVFFTDAAALRRWLLRDGALDPAGVAAAVRFAWGAAATVRIIANSAGRDVALGWDDGAAVIALRTLPSPRAADERILLITCSRWGGALDGAAAAGLRESHRRLRRVLESAGAA